MNVLYTPTRYFPSISGAELYIQRLAEILRSKYNITVKVLTSNAVDFKALRSSKGKIIEPHSKYLKSVNNVDIYRLSIDYELSLEQKLEKIQSIAEIKYLSLTDDTIKKFIQNGPFLQHLDDFFTKSDTIDFDIIHTTFYPYFNLILSLILAKRLNVPAICTPFFHFSNPRYLDPKMVNILKEFDLLVACTELEKKKIQNLLNIPGEKIKVIPMGVDYTVFSNANKKVNDFNFKKHYFQKNERKYKMILFCGYKNFEKGALSILKSIPTIIRRYKKVYFVFIGPSTIAFNRELAKIRKMKNLRIINLSPDNLTGYLDKKKISAFQKSDIYLMPSRSDAFGIAFLEAWSAGKPVVGANIGATPEVIRNQIDGLLVRFNDKDEICKAVLELLNNKALRKKLGQAGKEKVTRYYTWEKVVKKTFDIYSELKK